MFGGWRRRAKQRDDVDRLLAQRSLMEQIGNEEGSLVDEIGAHFGMTDAQVMAAAHGNPAIESFEDVRGRGMRLRYIGFRHIGDDFRTVMDAMEADGARFSADVKRVAREIGASPMRFDSKGRLILHSRFQRVLRKLTGLFLR